MSTAASRAMKRDYWNRPAVVRLSRLFDRAATALVAIAFVIAGSIN